MAGEESADRELFDHLVAEFGDRGRDSVGFLETAQRLVARDAAGDLPRRAGAAAYCIREALDRLLPAESGQPSWRRLSDEVLAAKTRFEAVRGLPGADDAAALKDLLTAIDRIEEFKTDERGQRERRLAGLMEARTGVPPLRMALSDYQRLVRELNDSAVHGSAALLLWSRFGSCSDEQSRFLGRSSHHSRCVSLNWISLRNSRIREGRTSSVCFRCARPRIT